jgi:hypothetical protein
VIDEIGCDKIVQYRNSMATKAALRAPASLDIEVTDGEGLDVDAWILDESIKTALPMNFLDYYTFMKEGRGDEVPARVKRQIRLIIKEVLKDA